MKEKKLMVILIEKLKKKEIYIEINNDKIDLPFSACA